MDSFTFFTFIIGATTVLVVLGAISWAKHLRLKMTWWKWSLSATWYLLLNFTVLAAFTLVGEGEPGAGFKFLLFMGVILIVLSVGLLRVLLNDRG